MRRISIQDVAQRAGVAGSTVSRALRNHPRIPPATCDRIQAIARQMGYHPDPLISALVNRRWDRPGSEVGTIAFLTSFYEATNWWNNPFMREVFQGAEAQCGNLGYRLETFWTREPGISGGRLSRILHHRGIRGVCLAPLPQTRGHLRLRWEWFSTAAVGYTMVRPSLHRASPHHFQGMMLTLRRLYQLGARRIVIDLSPRLSSRGDHGWNGGITVFQQLHPRAQIRFEEAVFSNRKAFLEWLEPDQADTFLTLSPQLRAWAASVSQETGGRLRVVNLDWQPDSVYPGLDQKPFQVGAAAINLIVGQIQRNETGIPENPRIIMVEGSWRETGQLGASKIVTSATD